MEKQTIFLTAVLLCCVATFITFLTICLTNNTSINDHITDAYNNMKTNVNIVAGSVPIQTSDKDIYVPLPRVYSVPLTSVTPAKNQGGRGTCWAFSTLGFLEASYRANGYAKGWLKEDEYVSFSEQAYSLGVVDFCQANPTNEMCYGSGPANGSTEDGEPEMLYYFGEPVQKVLPETACPYVEDEKECPDRENKLKSNPISFKVKSIESAYSISSIKQLLLKHQLPLTWSNSISEQTFYILCNSKEGLPDTKICKECLFPVSSSVTPDENGNYDPASCYTLYTTNSYDNEGHFTLHGKPFLAGGHGLLLVGYNDNYRINTGSQTNLDERTLGGFIVKNSWGTSSGHSLKYWTQEISIMEENLLCPDEYSAKSWLPVDTDCVLGGKSVQQCSKDAQQLYKRVRGQWIRGATVLKCNQLKDGAYFGFSECNINKNYVLASVRLTMYRYGGAPSGVWIDNDINGAFVAHFFEFDDDESVAPVLKATTPTTWSNLERIFTPKEVIGNDPQQCGFYFYPYQYFQEALARMPSAGHDALGSMSYYDIEWADSSYLANAASYSNFNYDFLRDSTKQMKVYNFTGPIDFNEVKSQ